MLFFTIYYNKFSFNQVFRSKKPCGFAYRADFCRFLCFTKKPAKICAVSKTAWPFGPEDLVKTKFIIIYCKKNMDRTF